MAADHSSAGLSSSLTDLMTSLAVIFILLLVASLNNAQQEGAETRTEIREELKRALNQYTKLEVSDDPKDPLGLVVLIPEELLQFEKNKDEVPLKGKDFLKKFVPILSSTVCGDRFEKMIHSVVVEGHTDSDGDDELNLKLSQSRSMSVIRLSLEVLRDPGLHQLYLPFLNLISASGRGELDLIHDKSGSEDMPRSRRVVFKIRVRSLEQRPLGEALGGMMSVEASRKP